MKQDSDAWAAIENTLDELISFQQNRLLKLGRQFIPNLTSDDILQPNDYPQLENHPVFRYEEGLLAGIQTVKAALRAEEQEFIRKNSNSN